jgi:selenocysteine lyase/cysteine desulfurase
MDRSRALLPATFGTGPGDGAGDVHIGPSTTQNTYVLARALRHRFDEGDEVIVTDQDHEANIGAWRRLAATGLTVRQWSVDPDRGLLHLADLEQLLTGRTRLVCLTHASNLAATLTPIREVVELARPAGAMVVVDGVSWAPHAALDVDELGCDIYLYSAYKTYGPHQGLVWTRQGLAGELANQGHFFNAGSPTARLTPAGPDHVAVAALAGMVDYYDELYHHHFGPAQPAQPMPSPASRIAAVFDLVARHEERLMAPLLQFLGTRGLRIVGSTSTSRRLRAPTVAFDPGATSPAAVVDALAAEGIGAGHGDFYARRLVDAVGLDDGVVRISMVHYNTVAEIERAIEVLDRSL